MFGLVLARYVLLVGFSVFVFMCVFLLGASDFNRFLRCFHVFSGVDDIN